MLLFQNIFIMLFSAIFSLLGSLFSFFINEDMTIVREYPEMSLYTQSSQGGGTVVALSGYGEGSPENPEFLKELLREYQPAPFTAEAGERAEAKTDRGADVYSVGWGDRPADVALWKIEADGSLSETGINNVSVSIRFGVLQLAFTMPEEDGGYLLTVYENYNIGPALHLVRFIIGDVEEPAVTDNGYIPPQAYDYDQARELGYVVVTNDSVDNVVALDRFINNWEQGKNASVYLVKEGKQGKPIVTLFLSRNGKLIAYNDYTQIGGEVFQKEYVSIGVQTEAGGFQYYVTDSDGEGYLLFRLESGTAVLKECAGTVVVSTPRDGGTSLLIYGTTNGQNFQKVYLNVFVDDKTAVTRSGVTVSSGDIQLGDSITAQLDTAYTSEVPNTVRAFAVTARLPEEMPA